MAPKTQTYLITPWSGRTMRARKHHTCSLCGGTIVSGTMYHRDVVRDGPNKGVDPLRNVHTHLNCHRPWWQADGEPDMLRQVGRLPYRRPKPTEHPPVPYLRPMVAVSSETVGSFTWKLSDDLEARIGYCKNEHRKVGAIAEIEHSLMLILTAITQSAGRQQKARELAIKLSDIASLL